MSLRYSEHCLSEGMVPKGVNPRMIAYVHGDICSVHALGDDLSIVDEDTAHRCLVRGECQLGLDGGTYCQRPCCMRVLKRSDENCAVGFPGGARSVPF